MSVSLESFTPSYMSSAQEQLVFEQTIEGLFLRGLHGKVTPALKFRLREIGLDLDKKLRPAYPFDIWMQSLKITAEELFPQHPLHDALFQLGESLIEGYRQTLMGKAVLGMVKVLGPKRTLFRSAQNFRSGNNYTETKVTEKSAQCIELWMNEVGPYPTFTAGIIDAAMRASGVNPIIVIEQHDGHGCTYLCSWK